MAGGAPDGGLPDRGETPLTPAVVVGLNLCCLSVIWDSELRLCPLFSSCVQLCVVFRDLQDHGSSVFDLNAGVNLSCSVSLWAEASDWTDCGHMVVLMLQ